MGLSGSTVQLVSPCGYRVEVPDLATAVVRKASPGPVPPGDYRRAPLAVYSAAVGSVTVPGWPMAAMAARCK